MKTRFRKLRIQWLHNGKGLLQGGQETLEGVEVRYPQIKRDDKAGVIDMKDKVSKALKRGLIVMWNNGSNQYRKIKRVSGIHAFFEDSPIEHIDLTNVNDSDMLFLKEVPGETETFNFMDSGNVLGCDGPGTPSQA